MFSKRQFIITATIFVGTAVGGVALILNSMQTKAFESEAQNRANLVLQFAKASRTYTKETLRPAVEDQTDDMVFEAMSSTFVSNGIVNVFREKMPEYIYKQATLNPLNLNNKADDYEADLVAQFKDNPSLETLSGYRTVDHKEYYYTATPVLVEPKCLKCHDSAQKVLATQPEIIERYGSDHGFDWIVGDTVAAQIVQIPTDDLRAQSAAFRKTVLGIFGFLSVLLVGASYFFFNKVLKEAAEARLAKEAADEANQSKTAFLASMSHEIRTPMTAILGFADTIRENGNIDNAPNDRVDAIDTIKRNGVHLLNIINDILDLSKIESGNLEVEQIECSPIQIITDATTLMSTSSTAKGIDLNITFDGMIPETIKSDPTRLRQILINIIGNAIKFTETGSVTICTSLIHAGDDSLLQFNVTDTGIGLKENQINKLFTAFSQADASTTRKFGGTGLGLNISKQFANMLGGDITITSAPGEGSTFHIQVRTESLDGVKILQDPQATFVAKPESNATKLNAPTTLNSNILLAEDGLDNQKLIIFILKKAGATVTLAENGKLALEAALEAKNQGNPFDVILMDMQMPLMDGYTAATQLREANYTGPIIALTANAMANDKCKCLTAGCDDFATKPINKPELLSLIDEYTISHRKAA